jgi:mannitol-1-phosphate/altronate dehydrogenase
MMSKVMGCFDTRTAAKQEAQDILLHGVAVAMSYWQEQHPELAEQMTEAEEAEFQAVLHEQADRLAKVFGYSEQWGA